MTISRLVAIGSIVLLTVGFICPTASAADDLAAAATQPPYSGLVPDDAFAAAVIYPRRLLTDRSLAKFDIEGASDDLADLRRVSLLDTEELLVLIGPRATAANTAAPSVATVLRMSKPHGGEQYARQIMQPFKAQSVEIAGLKCFRPIVEPGRYRHIEPVSVAFLDDRTFLVATDAWFPKLLAPHDGKSPLAAALAGSDSGDDATFIFTNNEAAEKVLASAIPAGGLPGPLKPFGNWPKMLQAAKLRVRLRPDLSLRLSLLANDDASAKTIAGDTGVLHQLGESFLPQLQSAPRDKVRPSMRDGWDLLVSLATSAIHDLVPQQTGKWVVVDAPNLCPLDALMGKLALPALGNLLDEEGWTMGLSRLGRVNAALVEQSRKGRRFPAHAIFSKDGKPLLSWRVYLLPYIGQEDLYRQFHLDEPWDSAHNKPLIAQMPSVYRSFHGRPRSTGQTRFLVAVGKGTMFDGSKGIALDDIPDGAGNTMLMVEVGDDKAVPWTKPEDWTFDPQAPMAGLGMIGGNLIAAGFAGGVSELIDKGMEPDKFRNLVIRNDGLPKTGRR